MQKVTYTHSRTFFLFLPSMSLICFHITVSGAVPLVFKATEYPIASQFHDFCNHALVYNFLL